MWEQVHVTVGPLRLIGAGAIKVPFRKIYRDTESKKYIIKNICNTDGGSVNNCYLKKKKETGMIT